ncbi:hypothetical protein EYF80_060165 [Liparis tanakae]|uniref:Uncharacterized protein n=1 Tax=Liparis tanakae TaxID=230148 RepID=A0A4Z2ELP1_9TELE|nr:hypothetical protein EYF80_060165 [Liparis tanakae]
MEQQPMAVFLTTVGNSSDVSSVTSRDEVDTQDEDASQQQRGRLAEVPCAELEQQQGDDVGRHLHHGGQEAADVRVAVHVGGVEDKSVVAQMAAGGWTPFLLAASLRTASASSTRPWLSSQRGDSGINLWRPESYVCVWM